VKKQVIKRVKKKKPASGEGGLDDDALGGFGSDAPPAPA